MWSRFTWEGDGMTDLLQVTGLSTGYGQMQILWDVALDVAQGERVVILGANGAGKTTLLKTLVGLLPTWRGDIEFAGDAVSRLRTDMRIRKGISYLSEVGVVATLSIEDNLRLGGYHLPSNQIGQRMTQVLDAFPELKPRRKEAAGSLSGGQRKMVAVARALMSGPKLVVMDEPSAGLSPLFVNEVVSIVKRFESEHMAFLIAEQNTKFLEVADRVFVLDSGRIAFSGTVTELQENDAIRKAYFGITS
jgi:branched-chain amino acid transport system ATP-binding protein